MKETAMKNKGRYLEIAIGVISSTVLLLGAWLQFLPFSLTESFGFITGAVGVWLTVKQNIWNWPIGIANNIFFIILFLDARLYADTGLQIVYIILSILGWYWWLRGGENKTRLRISHIDLTTGLIVTGLLVFGTFGMTLYLDSIADSAPFLDALTTVLSLIAQYMLTRKMLENWYVWIFADIIYIGLYIYKGLYLTSGLYVIFMAMCVVGFVRWRQSFRESIVLENPETAFLKQEVGGNV
jgi:nicotinamide mononucleotide transporter